MDRWDRCDDPGFGGLAVLAISRRPRAQLVAVAPATGGTPARHHRRVPVDPHPMYASQWLWSVAQPLLLQNWIAGWSGLLLFLPLYLSRVPREEQMMLVQFGEAYRAYMRRTGRVIPRLEGRGT